jgi:hypothetical protein
MPTNSRLEQVQLAKLGGAFAAGYDGALARARYEEGISFSARQDLSLALGWPFLVELEPPTGMDDPVGVVLRRLSATLPPRSWPIDLLTRAVRLLATGYVRFPLEPKPESVAAAGRDDPFAPDEAKVILATMFARPKAGWRHALWLLGALEALDGGGPVIDGVLDALESRSAPWVGVNAVSAQLVARLGYLIRRLPSEEVHPRRERAASLLNQATERVPGLLDDPKRRLVPSRRLVLMSDDLELIRRGSVRYEGLISLADAAYLPREEFLATLRAHGQPTEGEAPSAQHVVVGGPEVLDIELERWRGYGVGMDKPAAHAYLLDQYGMFRLPGAVALIAGMAAKSAVKDDALQWLRSHAAFAEPVLAELAKSSGAAKESADKALRALARAKPS